MSIIWRILRYTRFQGIPEGFVHYLFYFPFNAESWSYIDCNVFFYKKNSYHLYHTVKPKYKMEKSVCHVKREIQLISNLNL